MKIKLKLKYGIEQGVLVNNEDDLLIFGGQDGKGATKGIVHMNLSEMKTHVKA